MRRFVIVGQKATTAPEFSLDDLPSTSGRLDVLLRCMQTALLVSHGLRRDAIVYLVLTGGPRPPRAIRVDGRTAEYVRPDERSLAGLVKKLLSVAVDTSPGFLPMAHGMSVAAGGLEAVLCDLGSFTPYILEEKAGDLRESALDLDDPVFFIGDHVGFDEATRARLADIGARPIAVGPMSVHADDAIAILWNELDRRDLGRIDDSRARSPTPA
jgi:tRNA (pseudouridine54-N1)-methyltransferase